MMQCKAPSSPVTRRGRSGAPGLLRRRAALLVCSAVTVLWGLASIPANAQIVMSGPYLPDTLYAQDYNVDSVVRPEPVAGKQSAAASTITFDFSADFPQAARTAFQYAAGIWESHLQSEVTITIEASWDSLGASTLGTAGPRLVANFPGAHRIDTWYASALAESIAGVDFTGDAADIVATFNSEFPDWYFGTDGNPPQGKYDLVTVVLHEFGHGLGFVGSFDIEDGDPDNGRGECAGTDVAGMGCWGVSTGEPNPQTYPMIFDRFTEDQNDVPLLKTSVYPNPSTALADELESGNVFFDATSSRAANLDIPVILYAPTPFEEGSSFSHLDESTFREGTPSSLMTPKLARQEVIHSPGPVTCAIMQDIGWQLGPACLNLVQIEEPITVAYKLEPFGPNPFRDVARARLVVDSAQSIRTEVYNVAGQLIVNLPQRHVLAQQGYVIELDAAQWPSGLYFVRITGETFSAATKVIHIR